MAVAQIIDCGLLTITHPAGQAPSSFPKYGSYALIAAKNAFGPEPSHVNPFSDSYGVQRGCVEPQTASCYQRSPASHQYGNA
jgi:hypothetical protein